MTLSVLEGNSAVANLFKVGISYLWHIAWSLGYYRVSCFNMAAIYTKNSNTQKTKHFRHITIQYKHKLCTQASKKLYCSSSFKFTGRGKKEVRCSSVNSND